MDEAGAAARRAVEDLVSKGEDCRTLEELSRVQKADLEGCLRDLVVAREKNDEYAIRLRSIEERLFEQTEIQRQWRERADASGGQTKAPPEELNGSLGRGMARSRQLELSRENSDLKKAIRALEKQVASMAAVNAEMRRELESERRLSDARQKREKELARRAEDARTEAGRALDPFDEVSNELQIRKVLSDESEAEHLRREAELEREVGSLTAAAALSEAAMARLEQRMSSVDQAGCSREKELICCIESLERQIGKSAIELEEERSLPHAGGTGSDATKRAADEKAELAASICALEKKAASLEYLNDHANKELSQERGRLAAARAEVVRLEAELAEIRRSPGGAAMPGLTHP